MATRIFQLAKQLNVESKILVDICKQLGMEGKNTHLASLSDEEAALVRDHLTRKKSGRGASSVGRASSRQAGTAVAGAELEVVRREDYIPPGGASAKTMPVISRKPAPIDTAKKAKPEKPPEPSADTPAKPDATGPSIKLPPIPKGKQPSPAAAPEEPPPQKPDLKLPADAIRARRFGSRPLSEHLRRQQQVREGEQGDREPMKEPAAEAVGEPKKAPVGERDRRRDKEQRPPKDRGRRPGRVAALEEEPEHETAEFDRTLGGREQRQLRRKRAVKIREPKKTAEGEEEEDTQVQRPVRRLRRIRRVSTAAPRKTNVVVQLPCTVRSFSEALGIPAAKVQAKLLELGVMGNINTPLDPELAELLAESLEVQVDFRREVDLEEELLARFHCEDAPERLQLRPPVVTFLGHVDHGKTSLLDRIIGIDVVSKEKGGITQHIRAYRVEHDGRAIAFVDTPGHEAFTAMRARGAHCTDIAVLVVAADDGVMPQTEEAIAHARAAGVPIVVALNKIDLPAANPDRVLQQLAAHELLPSQWGGDVEVVRTSAVTGEGIAELLDTMLTVAELHEYRADPDGPVSGVCLEASVQQGIGVMAKMLVQRGTLRVGHVVLCGATYGRVKAMFDTLVPENKYEEAPPSTPVDMVGLEEPPAAGERFYVLEEISDARAIALRRAAQRRMRELVEQQPHVTLETLFERLGKQDRVQTLNLILRADVRGSIEAIRKELEKLQHPEVQIRVLQASVGGITEGDVELANASDAVIIGFNVVPAEAARSLAERYGVQIRRYDIIYQVTDDLRAALEGMLRPEKRETELGRALVMQAFSISRVGTVAGCRVIQGMVARDGRARVIRDSRIIGDYAIESLKRVKDDVREVREGYECGIKLAGFNDVKQGDLLEVYRVEEVQRHL